MKAPASSPFVSQRMSMVDVSRYLDHHEILGTLIAFAEAGQLTSAIDRSYPLSDTAEASRYLETGQVRGRS